MIAVDMDGGVLHIHFELERRLTFVVDDRADGVRRILPTIRLAYPGTMVQYSAPYTVALYNLDLLDVAFTHKDMIVFIESWAFYMFPTFIDDFNEFACKNNLWFVVLGPEVPTSYSDTLYKVPVEHRSLKDLHFEQNEYTLEPHRWSPLEVDLFRQLKGTPYEHKDW